MVERDFLQSTYKVTSLFQWIAQDRKGISYTWQVMEIIDKHLPKETKARKSGRPPGSHQVVLDGYLARSVDRLPMEINRERLVQRFEQFFA